MSAVAGGAVHLPRRPSVGGGGEILAAPIGGINLNPEPKTIGHILRSLYGAPLSGIMMHLTIIVRKIDDKW